MSAGYYRFPTICQDTIVFVSEDDLWSIPVAGGVARRLTSNLGEVTYPMLSPDGEWLAFVGREEGGPEVYLMASAGGTARRLTYLNSNCRVIGWSQDGESIIFASSYKQPFAREMILYQIRADCQNGDVMRLPYGPARSLALGDQQQVVLGRNTGDPARWKRYRGGTAGHLWIDRTGEGNFERFLSNLVGNIASPMWIGTGADARVFFVSDHEGIGNLYSATVDGDDMRRHTDHEDYYVRNPSSDGRRIVFHVGADLFVYDPAADEEVQVQVAYRSPRVQRNRKFVNAGRYMDSFQLHPTGRAIATTTRGKTFAFFNHEGPVLQYGKRDGIRYRRPQWLKDGRHIVLISDEPGEETLEIYPTEPGMEPRRLDDLDLGRVVQMKVSPVADHVAITNHRHELLLVDLTEGDLTLVDRSAHNNIEGFDWSPDGRWIAYSFGASPRTNEIRLYRLPERRNRAAADTQDNENGHNAIAAGATRQAGEIFTITVPVLHDVAPAFDPDGKYLYFLSYREFNPVYDGLRFDLSFPWGMRPYLITLQADLPNPFVPAPDLADEDDSDEEGDEPEEDDEHEDEYEDDDIDDGDDVGDEDSEPEDGATSRLSRQTGMSLLAHPHSVTPIRAEANEEDASLFSQKDTTEKPEPTAGEQKKKETTKAIQIDLDGIERRVIAFPVPDARYRQIAGIPGKAIFSVFPVHGQLDSGDDWDEDEASSAGTLKAYDFKEYRTETLVDNVHSFEISLNRKKLLYASNGSLRVISAGDKAPSSSGHPRKTGWIDMNRIKVSVDPQSEWEQMFREAWRLQRDHFWTEDMSEVDWHVVYQRYFQLIPRVSTRSEFSDLMWEMQGELATSHAYEFGGDYRPRPYYGQGFLGATLHWKPELGGYELSDIVVGDPWVSEATSPLAASGVDVQEGDIIVGVNGQQVDEVVSPSQLLVNQAGNEVLLTLLPRTAATGEGNSVQGKEANQRHDDAGKLRTVVVRTIRSETPARYRRWVEQNRARVHSETDGKVGYLHIPDMMARGFAEFQRGYLVEVERDGLIVDVRYNGGGHVSQLILEQLAQRRIGYDLSRWGGVIPYPVDSVAGPIVALTNEHAGSDGDIFCHSFKLLRLGPLIGKRTWGGVIGISPRHQLVDGTTTTQPEYSFWFEDVGWNVENYGTEPDIDVDIRPQDYVAESDPQLAYAIQEAMQRLAQNPVLRPQLEPRPSRALPKLPPRT